MRSIAIVSIMFATLSLCANEAQAAPWCAQYGGRGGGGTNCGFYSYQQCTAALSGNGGICSRNGAESSSWGDRESRRRYR